MKNPYYRSFSLLIILFISLQTAQAQNFGYVNSEEIIVNMPEMKQANAIIDALEESHQKRGQDMVDKLQADYAAIQQKIERGEISPAQQEQEAKKLEERQQQIAKFEQDIVEQLRSKQAELMEPITTKINNAIEAVAQEKGYKMVFDQSVLLYSTKALDVSRLVKTKLGIQ